MTYRKLFQFREPMKRIGYTLLLEWKNKHKRKPLVVRGARQVGKTYLVREFGKAEYENYLEINFERERELGEVFSKSDPTTILKNLEIHFSKRIQNDKTLLFLDEIQEFPEIYQKLRYFYEEVPELSIIVAGSLLDFIFEQKKFSVPVGRLEFFNLEPFSFFEFLLAKKEDYLLEQIRDIKIQEEVPALLHEKALKLFFDYCLVGGMPESVLTFVETGSFVECERIKGSLLLTFQEDFYKYAKRVDPSFVRKIFKSAVIQSGNKVKYSNLDSENPSAKVSMVLKLFEIARLFCPVYHSSCNQLPLGSEVNIKQFKYIFLDSGLYLTLCGVNALELKDMNGVLAYHSGKLFEQMVGKALLSLRHSHEDRDLYYWVREKKSSSAEVDFVFTHSQRILPLEAKAGKSGKLKSLHYFASEKKCSLAVRVNINIPALHTTKIKLGDAKESSFQLLSIPIYQVESLSRILDQT